jgi:hypothetical protein
MLSMATQCFTTSPMGRLAREEQNTVYCLWKPNPAQGHYLLYLVCLHPDGLVISTNPLFF